MLENLNHQEGYGSDDYEIIVVDDGSTCDTFGFISGVNRNYALKYIYLDREAISCRPRTRNMGWKVAEGEIIAFIDDDILVPNGYLKELDKFYNEHKDMVVIGTRIDLSAVEEEEYAYENVSNLAYKQNKVGLLETRHASFTYLSYNLSAHRFPWLMVFTCNMVVPKAMLEAVNGFSEDYVKWGWEDIDIGYRLSKLGYPIVLNPKIEGLHLHHKESRKIEDNKDLFVKKFPEAFEGLSANTITTVYALDILHYLDKNTPMTRTFRRDQGETRETITINFTDPQSIADVKKQVKELTAQKGLEIIIKDYVGDTTFHLWIQLLTDCESVPCYYPTYLFDPLAYVSNRARHRINKKGFI